MKSLTKTVMLFGLLLTMAGTKAQTQQSPHLFDAFSATIPCNNNELERIFTLAEGSTAQIQLATNFNLTGTVLNSIQRYSNLKTVLIKSSNFDRAALSISRRVNDDNSITYIGRILSENYGDGFEIIKQGNNYSLNKVLKDDLIQDK